MIIDKEKLLQIMEETTGFNIKIEIDDESDKDQRAYKFKIMHKGEKVFFFRDNDLTTGINALFLKTHQLDIPYKKEDKNE